MYIYLVSAISLALVGCGGGNSDDENNTPPATTTPKTGVFLDSAVSGIGYRTETLGGVTDANGSFQYREGETVTFFIGDLEFPPVATGSTITPLTFAGTTNTSTPLIVNISRLLQSLDTDGNPDNGIVIPDTASAIATTIDFTQSISDFASDSSVVNLVANSGSSNTTLIPEGDAISHLESTVSGLQDYITTFEAGLFIGKTVYDVYENSNMQFDKEAWTFASDGSLSVTNASDEIFFTGTYSFSEGDTQINVSGVHTSAGSLSGTIQFRAYNIIDNVYSFCSTGFQSEIDECARPLYKQLFLFDEAQADLIVSNNSYTPSE